MADHQAANEQVNVGATHDTPVETTTTDHNLFDLMKKDSEGDYKPITQDTFASEFDQKTHVSEQPRDYKDAEDGDEEKKHGTVVEMLRSYSSSSASSDEEGDGDEEKKQRRKEKKEKKGLKEKLMEKLPGNKGDEVTHVPTEQPHVQVEKIKDKLPGQDKPAEDHYEAAALPVEEPAEKKSFLNKIKDKLPGQNIKTDDHHEEAAPVAVVEGEDKKGFMDKIKDKIPGLSSSSKPTDNDEEKRISIK